MRGYLFPEFRRCGNVIAMRWIKKSSRLIVPFFIPFQGCSRRCLFCAQESQTGTIANRNAIPDRLKECREMLKRRARAGRPAPELAFYGGTFMALPEPLWDMCLNFARESIEAGLITSFRCSTRPDSVSAPRVSEMIQAGCRVVELGIQTFNDAALAFCHRDYYRADCLRAWHLIRRAGMEIVAQLMPGMPGCRDSDFYADLSLTLDLGVSGMRFYPCLVPRGTELAAIWARGLYAPLSVPRAAVMLARGLLAAIRYNVPVIRMGLAPQAQLADAILAGPWHPALGDMARGVALFLAVRQMLACASKKMAYYNVKAAWLKAPFFAQGCFWGWRGQARRRWGRLGLDSGNVEFVDTDYISLQPDWKIGTNTGGNSLA